MTLIKEELHSYTLEAVSVNETVVDNRKVVFMVVNTKSFLKTKLPNNANTRKFTGKKNKAVNAMIQTLRKEPENFRLKNLGIRVVASEIIRNGNLVTLLCTEEEGNFNGGHTNEVLSIYGNENAYVYVTVDVNLPREQLVDISVALNMSKRVEEYSIGEKIGAHEWIKKVLPSESIAWQEGDEGDHHVTDVLKVANLFRVEKNKKYNDSSLRQSLTRKKEVVKKNNENQPLTYTGYLLPDLWYLYKELTENTIIQSNLPNRFTSDNKLLQGIVLAFIYGIQCMTEINKNNIPMWKKEYSVMTALNTCEKVSKKIGKTINKQPFKRMTAEMIYKDSMFQEKIKRVFAEELL
ncbi:AIPR family protein [Rossellomorea aquimaris]|uniref:AIPR family protein n=1 Tax=Rossellomorea aquimaris TaxID=189382 RepID=UPI0005C9F1F3|nr:AIPR family protein [Rossellomorea aquimaris]